MIIESKHFLNGGSSYDMSKNSTGRTSCPDTRNLFFFIMCIGNPQNLVVMKICLLQKKTHKFDFFHQNVTFQPEFPIFVTIHEWKLLTIANDFRCKNIYFSLKKNKWSIFGQHLSNMCCHNMELNIAIKTGF